MEMNRNELPDAYIVVYSVIDKSSFQRAEDELARLQNWDALRGRALIVVGNKIDLARSRAVSTQGTIQTHTAHPAHRINCHLSAQLLTIRLQHQFIFESWLLLLLLEFHVVFFRIFHRLRFRLTNKTCQ